MKRKAIIIGEEPQKKSRDIEFTHFQKADKGWFKVSSLEMSLVKIDKIIYLGCCPADGDMFALYQVHGHISILKGYLNDGTY